MVSVVRACCRVGLYLALGNGNVGDERVGMSQFWIPGFWMCAASLELGWWLCLLCVAPFL